MDERQVNLTRFPLFFPEKREFFLEGRGIFGFARGGVTGRFGGPGGGPVGGVFGDVNVPQLFYSRKIGLERGRVVPIVGGARVTGKMGPFDVHAGDEVVSASEPTNFTAVRLRRDVLRRSSIGGMFTNRSVPGWPPGRRARPTGSTAPSRSSRTSASSATSPRPGFRSPSTRARTRATRASSSTRPTATACRSTTCWSRTTSCPRWGSSGATTSAAPTCRGGSARGRRRSRACDSSAWRAPSTTS